MNITLGTLNSNMQNPNMAAHTHTDSCTQNSIKSHKTQDQAPLGLDLAHASTLEPKIKTKTSLCSFTTKAVNTL